MCWSLRRSWWEVELQLPHRQRSCGSSDTNQMHHPSDGGFFPKQCIIHQPVLHRFTKIEQKFGSSPAVYKSNCGARMVIKEIKRSSILSSPSWTRGIHVWVTVCCWFFYCPRFDSSAEVDFKKIPERFDWCSVQIGFSASASLCLVRRKKILWKFLAVLTTN